MLRCSADATRNGACVPAEVGRWALDRTHRSTVPAGSSAGSSLRTALCKGWKLSQGRGGLRLNKKGQQSHGVITALWEQGETCAFWLMSNWAEAGLCCCQQVAFAAAPVRATSVAAGVRLGTPAHPEVSLAVSFPWTWPCTASSPPPWGVPGFLQATGIPPLWARCWDVCRISPMAFPSERYYVTLIKMSIDVFIHKCQRKGRLLTCVPKSEKWR